LRVGCSRWPTIGFAALLFFAAGGLRAAPAEDPLVWAFQNQAGGGAPPPPADKLFSVPGSAKVLPRAQIYDQFNIVDWFPDVHPAMPDGVAHGQKPAAAACGFCHLATGAGRPENATLAGLPADYIIEQVRQFVDGSRSSALPEHVPTVNMIRSAQAMPATDVAQAAAYFAALPRHGLVAVKERKTIPAVESRGFTYRVMPGSNSEPLGQRIIEVVDDFELFELRDPRTSYTAYVPPGSIRRGARLAARKNAALSTSCAGCHGADFGGIGLVPPLAGKSPSYLVRQFVNFKSGARTAASAQPMREVVKGLSNGEFIALAAYLGSLPVPDKSGASR
jgi:cytochrome c553